MKEETAPSSPLTTVSSTSLPEVESTNAEEPVEKNDRVVTNPETEETMDAFLMEDFDDEEYYSNLEVRLIYYTIYTLSMFTNSIVVGLLKNI